MEQVVTLSLRSLILIPMSSPTWRRVKTLTGVVTVRVVPCFVNTHHPKNIPMDMFVARTRINLSLPRISKTYISTYAYLVYSIMLFIHKCITLIGSCSLGEPRWSKDLASQGEPLCDLYRGHDSVVRSALRPAITQNTWNKTLQFEYSLPMPDTRGLTTHVAIVRC